MTPQKFIVALIASIGLLVLWQGLAFADGGPHGPYSALGVTTDGAACQRCHAPHRGQAANLIRNTSTYGLCTTCHSAAERTDVVAGAYLSGAGTYGTPNSYGADDPAAGSPTYTKQLNGGRFGSGATSWHKVKDTEETTTRIVYGIAAIDASDTTTSTFRCSTCHNPHGRTLAQAGALTVTTQTNGSTENYRLLTVPVYSWESVANTGNTQAGAIKAYTKQTLKYESEANSGISKFCAVCHIDYLSSTSAGGSSPNAPGGQRYVHRENVAITGSFATNLDGSTYKLPPEEGSAFRGFYQTSASTPKDANAAEYAKWLGGVITTTVSYDGTNDRLACLTCHNAHGSVATAAITSTTYNRAGTHSLQRFDERAVCQSCHKQNPSY